MTSEVGLILDRLEKTTAQLTEVFRLLTTDMPDLTASGQLLAERGELIAELTTTLEGNKSLTYVEYNRLLTIYVQGSQAVAPLMGLRAALGNLALQGQRQRAYADRLQGMVDPTYLGHSEEA